MAALNAEPSSGAAPTIKSVQMLVEEKDAMEESIKALTDVLTGPGGPG